MPDDPKKSVTQQSVGAWGGFLRWVRDTLSDDQVKAQVLRDLGLDPAQVGDTTPNFGTHADSIDIYRAKADPGAEALAEAIADLKAMYHAVRDVVDAARSGSDAQSETTDEVLHQLFRLLSLNYLRIRQPELFWLGQAAGFIEESFGSQRIPGPIGRGIVDAFLNTEKYLKLIYPWPIQTEAEAVRLSGATLAPLAVAIGFLTKRLYKRFEKLHIEQPSHRVLYGWEPVKTGSPTPVGDALNGRTLTFTLAGLKTLGDLPEEPANPCTSPDDAQPLPTLGALLSFSLNWVPAAHGGPGMFIALGGSGTLVVPIADGWNFTTEVSSAATLDFLITDWNEVDVGGPSDASVKIGVERPPSATGPTILTLYDGVRLEFEAFSFQLGVAAGGPTVALRARNSALVIDSDPLTARAYDTEKLRLDFDLGLVFANGKFTIEGGSDLRATLPINKSLGPITFQTVTVGLNPSTEPNTPDLRFEVSTSLVIRLPKLTFVVDRIGLDGAVQFWDDLDLGFKPPNGIGVEIDASVVRGGGFLFYDAEKGQYAGVLDLDLQDLFTVKAIGLVSTKPSFSFLVILAVEDFTPINLPLGFRITGFGGIFGYDRTVSMEALEAGLKSHALDRIMFPPDPVANAPAIVSVAGSVFPPLRDHLVVGPMVQIVWGAAQLVRIELALIFEFPTPGRLFILGKLKATLPLPQFAVIKIEVDVIGEIDFGRKQAFVHAVLVDSKIAGFPLSGAAALLLRWGDDPVFILAFGGVHPRYQQFLPTGFPKLERLSVPLTRGNNPRLRFEMYIAATSNSLQIGGKLEVFVSIGKFSIEGLLAIDALIQDGEPTYIFDFDFKLQIKAWGQNLFTARFVGTLQGSHPWHIRGEAKFSIWIFDYSIPLDHTFGTPAPPPALPPVDVRTPLLAALGDPRNWRAQPPRQGLNPVTVRADPGSTDLLVHPLGRLAVSQRVLPLGVSIDRVGPNRPSGTRLFNIDRASVSGTTVGTSPLNDQFARAQFFDMSDDEKLSSPPFESMPAGIEIGTTSLASGPGIVANADYDTFIYDAATGTSAPDAPYAVPASRMPVLSRVGTRVQPGQKYRAPAPKVQIGWPRYVVTSTDDLSLQSVPGVPVGGTRTYTEAASALRARLAARPEQIGKLQLVTVNG